MTKDGTTSKVPKGRRPTRIHNKRNEKNKKINVGGAMVTQGKRDKGGRKRTRRESKEMT